MGQFKRYWILTFVICMPAAGDDPAGPTHGFPATAFEYAKMVEEELGVPPRVDLSEGVEIPMYVDGVAEHGISKTCDNPSRLGKGCVSGSVLQRYEGRTADGKPMPDVVWVSFGRNGTYIDREGNTHIFGSVQMIGHDTFTGATAFFESSDAIAPWATVDENHRLHGKMPWIDDPDAFNQAFRTPEDVQCVECHQNDPFIHSDFIDAAKLPGSDDTVVPRIRNPDRVMEIDLPYHVIGGETWDMRTIHVEGNRCLGCHRIGMSTATLFMSNGWHPNDHMPPRNPGRYADDFDELFACWEAGPDETPGCDWVIPPAGYERGRVVGDDYPFKSAFNEPGQRAHSLTGQARAPKVESDGSRQALIKAMKAKGMSEDEIETYLESLRKEAG